MKTLEEIDALIKSGETEHENLEFKASRGDSRRVYRRKDQPRLRLLGSYDLHEAGRSHQVISKNRGDRPANRLSSVLVYL
jgi:hypothetical protein